MFEFHSFFNSLCFSLSLSHPPLSLSFFFSLSLSLSLSLFLSFLPFEWSPFYLSSRTLVVSFCLSDKIENTTFLWDWKEDCYPSYRVYIIMKHHIDIYPFSICSYHNQCFKQKINDHVFDRAYGKSVLGSQLVVLYRKECTLPLFPWILIYILWYWHSLYVREKLWRSSIKNQGCEVHSRDEA